MTPAIIAPPFTLLPSEAAILGVSVCSGTQGSRDVAFHMQNLLQHELHIIGRDGESEANISAAAKIGVDLVVNADDLAFRIEEGPSGISVVDGGVRLNKLSQAVLHQDARQADYAIDYIK